METLIQALKAINDVIWGPGMLILLIGTGLYLTVGLRFYTFRNIFSAFSMLWKGRTSSAGDKGELTPFNALMTALAGTIGTGSIVGVATAILSGGPGALFWMWCTAMVGMATKFSEILLAVRYREVTPAGNFVGGAMYFIKNGLGEKWKWLGGLFAIFAAITCFGTGNAVQTNAISGVLWGTFGVPTWITALILFLLIASVLLGGLRRIGSVAGKIVPFMAILYTLASLLIIILNIKEVPAMFLHVIEEAFTPTAAQGGFAGATAMMAVRFGMARGTFAITSACEDPAALLRWVDTLYTQEGAIEAMVGVAREDYVVDEEGGWNWKGGIEAMTTSTLSELSVYDTGDMPWLFPQAFYNRYDEENVRRVNGELEKLDAYVKKPFPTYTLTQEESAQVAQWQSELGPYVDETLARVVLGQQEADGAAREAFREGLRQRGMESMIAFWQNVAQRAAR